MLKSAICHDSSELFLLGWVALALCNAHCFDGDKGASHCAGSNGDPPSHGTGIYPIAPSVAQALMAIPLPMVPAMTVPPSPWHKHWWRSPSPGAGIDSTPWCQQCYLLQWCRWQSPPFGTSIDSPVTTWSGRSCHSSGKGTYKSDICEGITKGNKEVSDFEVGNHRKKDGDFLLLSFMGFSI